MKSNSDERDDTILYLSLDNERLREALKDLLSFAATFDIFRDEVGDMMKCEVDAALSSTPEGRWEEVKRHLIDHRANMRVANAVAGDRRFDDTLASLNALIGEQA